MKLIFCILILWGSTYILSFSQDTIYRKSFEKYEGLVIKKGYDLLFAVKYEDKVDSVCTYKYGAYMHTYILDMLIKDDKYCFIYGQDDYIGLIIRQRNGLDWPHLMGGSLRFISSNNSAKIEAKIEDGGVIKLYETEKSANAPKVTTYVLDYVNKVISKQADK
jgi:hypothetical protein